jgi:hypothetical protein
MKRILLIVIFLGNQAIYAQALDQHLNIIGEDLATRIIKKGKKQVALLDFTTENGQTNALTRYVQEFVEFHLINTELEVLDRKHLKLLLSENRLQSDGLINETTAKAAVGFTKIEGWILGEVISNGDEVIVRLKVLDIATSRVFAASMTEKITDRKVSVILQPKSCYTCNGSGNIDSKVKCTICQGTGGPRCTHCQGSGVMTLGLGGKPPACEFCMGRGKVQCTVCKGTGQEIQRNACLKCSGTGKIYSRRMAEKSVLVFDSLKIICNECKTFTQRHERVVHVPVYINKIEKFVVRDQVVLNTHESDGY